MDVLPAGGFDKKEFLRLAASLEQNSDTRWPPRLCRARRSKASFSRP